MQAETCAKCGANEMLSELKVYGGAGNPPFVQITEPQPEKSSFIWVPKLIQSEFKANICGACGYTEFYAVKCGELNEGRKKGYKSKA